MHDIETGGRLLLGTVGWERPDWLSGYYPEDLPAEWRLAYYANDCGCVLLPAGLWSGMDRNDLEQAVWEAPEGLVFFLEAPASPTPDAGARLAIFPLQRTVLLVAEPVPRHSTFPQWLAKGADRWTAADSGASLVRWSVAAMDLRDLRARAGSLDGQVRALVLDGAGADPGRIPDLRRLLELLGRA